MNQLKFLRVVFVGAVLIVPVIFGILAGVWSTGTTTQAQQITKSETRDIRIEIPPVSDSPILISSPTSITTDAYNPSYTLTLTNVGIKPIRAYTLKVETRVGDEGKQLNESRLFHLISQDLVLQPNHSRQEINNGTGKFPEPVTQINTSIDFVEFSDGTTWGKDIYHSAESLAGERAGGAAAIAYFKRQLDAGQFDPQSIENDARQILETADSSKSKAWKRGFQTGIGIVRNRINKSQATSGIEGVRQELTAPFDASDGRKIP